MSGNQINCSNLINTGAVAQPDADVAGIGVVLAFVLSAYITFATVFFAYVFGYVDDSLLNPIDRKVFRIRPYEAAESPRTYKCIRKAMLALGDQQIVTGIAIMSAGFQGLRTGNMSVYHYQLVLYLAWMSSSVHLSALTLLGSWLNHHRGVMAWRLAGMLVLLFLLVVGLVPTLSNDWGLIQWGSMSGPYTALAIPAVCFWGEFWGDGSNDDTVLSFIILIVSYAWKIGALFSSTRSGYNRRIRYPLENLFIAPVGWSARRCRASRGKRWMWAYRATLSLILPILVLMEVAASFAASLWLSCLGLVFGTMEVIIPRQEMQPYVGSQEGGWGFGQLVPLILLIQPLGAVCEHIWTKPKLHHQHHSAREDLLSQHTRPPVLLDEPGAVEAQTRPDSLLPFLASLDSRKLTDSQRADMKAIMVQSKLFTCHVWLIQVGMVGLWSFVFFVDAWNIGYDRPDQWIYVVITLGGYVGVAVLITAPMLPFSRLGRWGAKGRSIKRAETALEKLLPRR